MVAMSSSRGIYKDITKLKLIISLLMYTCIVPFHLLSTEFTQPDKIYYEIM